MAVRVNDVAPDGYAVHRATVRQKKTSRPIRFELTEQTQQAIGDYSLAMARRPRQFLSGGRRAPKSGPTTSQHARLVGEWIGSIELDPLKLGTHTLGRTKAVLIYRRSGNLRVVQLLLGQSKIESTVEVTGPIEWSGSNFS